MDRRFWTCLTGSGLLLIGLFILLELSRPAVPRVDRQNLYGLPLTEIGKLPSGDQTDESKPIITIAWDGKATIIRGTITDISEDFCQTRKTGVSLGMATIDRPQAKETSLQTTSMELMFDPSTQQKTIRFQGTLAGRFDDEEWHISIQNGNVRMLCKFRVRFQVKTFPK